MDGVKTRAPDLERFRDSTVTATWQRKQRTDLLDDRNLGVASQRTVDESNNHMHTHKRSVRGLDVNILGSIDSFKCGL